MPPKAIPPSTAALITEAMHMVAQLDEEGCDPTEIERWCNDSADNLYRRRAVSRALDSRAALFAAEAKRCSAAAKASEAANERIKAGAEQLLLAAEQLGENVGPGCGLPARLQASESVTGPDDGAAWPLRFQRVRIEPDKVEAKRALQAGEVITGLALVSRRSLRWT